MRLVCGWYAAPHWGAGCNATFSGTKCPNTDEKCGLENAEFFKGLGSAHSLLDRLANQFLTPRLLHCL